jgi:hypothetical protein
MIISRLNQHPGEPTKTERTKHADDRVIRFGDGCWDLGYRGEETSLLGGST